MEPEFHGLLISNGKIGYSKNSMNLIFSTREFSIVRKIVKMTNALKIKRKEDILQKENNKIILEFKGVDKITTFDLIKKKAKQLPKDGKKAFLRGVFLGCGILSTPPSYHIELRFEKEKEANFTDGLLKEFSIKHLTKNNIIYITGRENVKAFLYEIGAMNTYILLEEDAVNKKMTNEANRKANFEFANLKRQSNASTKQIEILKRMEEDGSINDLSEELREVAMLRLQYPYSSLRELSEKSTSRLSKQSIYYRLKKIIKAYEK